MRNDKAGSGTAAARFGWVSGITPDIVVGQEEDIPEILTRIRAHRTSQVVLDCADHRILFEQGHVRKVLAAAAADLGKTLVFAARQPSDRLQPLSASRSQGLRPAMKIRSKTVGAFPRNRVLSSVDDGFTGVTRIRRGGFLAQAMRPVRLLAAFAFVAGALLAGVVLFILPRAHVTLTTVAEPLSADLSVVLAADGVPLGTAAEAPKDDSAGTHPARHVVVQEIIQGEFQVETVIETGERARGTVALINRTRAPQGIKSGTRLESERGIIVRTERDVIIPPKGQVQVGVRAESGGTAANFSPQRLSMPALPEESRGILFAEVVEPLQGGTDRPIRRLALADIKRGVEALKGQAEIRLKEKLQAEFGGEGTWLGLSELSRVAVEEETPSVLVGTETGTFRLRAKARAEALTAPVEELRTLFGGLLRTRAGEGKDIARDPSLDELRVLDVRWDDLNAALSLHAETTVVPALRLDIIKEQLLGRSLSDVEAFLRHLEGVRSASVLLSPVWVKHVPRNRRNVHIKLESLKP